MASLYISILRIIVQNITKTFSEKTKIEPDKLEKL